MKFNSNWKREFHGAKTLANKLTDNLPRQTKPIQLKNHEVDEIIDLQKRVADLRHKLVVNGQRRRSRK